MLTVEVKPEGATKRVFLILVSCIIYAFINEHVKVQAQRPVVAVFILFLIIKTYSEEIPDCKA